MGNFMTRIIGAKKDWKAMEARADALPREYRIVYGDLKSYLWKFTAGDGMDIVAVLRNVLGLFEVAVAEGKGVVEVVGDDVAAFCDERLPAVPSFVTRWRASLNRDVAVKLAR